MPMIDSAQNATYKRLLSLTTSKGLKKEDDFLLSGTKLVAECVIQNILPIHAVITARGMTLPPILQDLATHMPQGLIDLDKALFETIDVMGTHAPLLLVQQPAIENLRDEDIATYHPVGLEVAVPTGDPSNLGALLRSCEAFGVRRVLLTREAAHPLLPKCVKASAGSVLRVPMAYAPALSSMPRDAIALDAKGSDIFAFSWPQNALLIVGEEGQGHGDITSAPYHHLLSIPTHGVESLNVVVATSIALALASRGKA